MNDHQEENASRIALYLENRLSQEEREAFKRSLGEDDELRVQYVEALMNRVGTGTNAGGTVENPGGSGGPAGDTLPLKKRLEVSQSSHSGKSLKLSKSMSIWLDNRPVLATDIDF